MMAGFAAINQHVLQRDCRGSPLKAPTMLAISGMAGRFAALPFTCCSCQGCPSGYPTPACGILATEWPATRGPPGRHSAPAYLRDRVNVRHASRAFLAVPGRAIRDTSIGAVHGSNPRDSPQSMSRTRSQDRFTEEVACALQDQAEDP